MKAEDVRIRNLFKEGIVNSISANSVQLKDNFGNLSYNLTPIPLSEQWLLDFGYTEDDISTGKIISTHGGGFIINKLSTSKVFFYVHKLQNFYYEFYDKELSLTNKELK